MIPGWKIIRTIGKGSSGCVYEIEKEDTFGGVVHSALKVISIPENEEEIKAYRDDGYDDVSLTKLFRSQVESITAEFKLMSNLKGYSNIVSYEDHSIVQHDNDPGYDIYIRMELLSTLPNYINKMFPNREISDSTVAKLGIDICNALQLCAKYHIIHRDIKPQNIFVNDNGDFKLGDFGVAKTSDHTTKATLAGTYSYMAPEVFLCKPYNASVDLYSLGLVMYWMLNERRGPFLPLPPEVPTPEQTAEARERRMTGELLPLPKYGNKELSRIILKACAFHPEDRYATPTEMMKELEQILPSNSDSSDSDKEKAEVEEDISTGTVSINWGNATGNIYPPRDIEKQENNLKTDSNFLQKKQEQKEEPITPEQKETVFQATPAKPIKRRIWLGVAIACAVIIVAAAGCFIAVNQCKKQDLRASAIYTEEPRSEMTAASTIEQTETPVETTPDDSLTMTSESSPTFTKEPTSESTAESKSEPDMITYSIDRYFSDLGIQPGSKITNLGKNIVCMWKEFDFGGSYKGRITVAQKTRKNALLFYVEYADKAEKQEDKDKSIEIDGITYQGHLQGYFDLANKDGYETLEFSLCAASQPEQFFGSPATHGLYRLTVYANRDQECLLQTDWLDNTDCKSYSLDISKASRIRFQLEQTYGSDDVLYTLNPAMYNVKFMKTEVSTSASADMPNYITEGVFFLKTVSDSYYLGLGEEKVNLKGDVGYYLCKTEEIQSAIPFSVVSGGEQTASIQIPNLNGTAYYLDAFNPKRDNYGADIWKAGNTSDQRWIIENQSDGTFLIYLEAYPDMYLTNGVSEFGDVISTCIRRNDHSQNWYLVMTGNN